MHALLATVIIGVIFLILFTLFLLWADNKSETPYIDLEP